MRRFLLRLALASTVLVGSAASAASQVVVGTEGPLPTVTDHDAVIVWHEADHLEDLVFRITLSAEVERVAIVVPTPTPPVVSEESPVLLDAAEPLLGYRLRYRRHYAFDILNAGTRYSTKVRGSDAFYLPRPAPDRPLMHADAPADPTDWLTEHGYAMRPALARWIETYADQHYAFTTFEYERLPEDPLVTTRAMRLRFTTDRPFYPYRDAEDAPHASPFRLTVFAHQPMRALAGDHAYDASDLRVRSVDPATLAADSFPSDWLSHYTFEGRPPGAWTSLIHEAATQRGTEDLFFEPDPGALDDTEEHVYSVPQPTYIPVDCACVFTGLGILFLLVGSRRRKRPPGGRPDAE